MTPETRGSWAGELRKAADDPTKYADNRTPEGLRNLADRITNPEYDKGTVRIALDVEGWEAHSQPHAGPTSARKAMTKIVSALGNQDHWYTRG